MTVLISGFSADKVLSKLRRRRKNRAPQPDAGRARYTALVDGLATDVYCYAYALYRDRHLAEEITQETFLRARKSFHQLRAEVAAKSWLFTIAKREYARHLARPQPEWVDIDIASAQFATESTLSSNADVFLLHQALMQLPADYREALVLQVIGGYSLEEIATRLGVSVGAATSRVFRARQNRLLPPFVIKQINGLNVAVLGITNSRLPVQNPLFSLGFAFTKGYVELPEIITDAKTQGADLIGFKVIHIRPNPNDGDAKTRR